ncbi:MAG: GNAT family N-acetyltransferase [Anaerolineales bacterium]|nr:MAG: GNAT family N-acetyltransferase [Anaerolineales bacterium]
MARAWNGFADRTEGRRHENMRLQPYRKKVLPKVLSLLNEAEAGSHEFIPYGEESLQAELKGASPVLLATDDQDHIAGFGYLSRQWYGEIVTLHVRPGPGQWEAGDLLLSVLEPRNQTGELSTLADTFDHERLGFFLERGYRSDSSLYQMTADLDHRRRRRRLPVGCTIGSLRTDEEEAFIQVANTAYTAERLRPGILAQWQAQDPDFSTDWVHVARCDGQLVATVVARSDREYNEYFHANRGYLGPAATLPSYRGKGLSQALTVRAMDFLRERGMGTVCLYTWEGNQSAVRLTTNLGFRVAHEWKILSKKIRR